MYYNLAVSLLLVSRTLFSLPGALEGVSGAFEGVSGTLEGVSGELEGVSGTLEGSSGALEGSETLITEKRNTELDAELVSSSQHNYELDSIIQRIILEKEFIGASESLEWFFRLLKRYCSHAKFDSERFTKDCDELGARFSEIETFVLSIGPDSRIRSQLLFTRLVFMEMSSLNYLLGTENSKMSYGILLQCLVHMNIRLLLLHDSYGSFGWNQRQPQLDLYRDELSFSNLKLELWHDMTLSFDFPSASQKEVLENLILKARKMLESLSSYL